MKNTLMKATLVLSGGLGLGAYQPGAYEAMMQSGRFQVRRIAGSSVGAVNAVVIAGSKSDEAVGMLNAFWSAGDLWFLPANAGGYFGHAQNWLSVIHTRLFGTAGHFRPRIPSVAGPFRSFYDLTPMRERIVALVDFERLNAGNIQVAVAATDIETGELVIFDTAKGHRITIDHVLASCGFLPEFAPVEIDGRLLGDGGLSANAPIEAAIGGGADELVFVIDLFPRDGTTPNSLEDALARKNDLLFANQTLLRLEAWTQARKIERAVYLSYRPSEDEAGAEKTFDLSRGTIARRWASSFEDMVHALSRIDSEDEQALTVVRRAA
jgi:NTE family protein